MVPPFKLTVLPTVKDPLAKTSVAEATTYRKTRVLVPVPLE
jgi:hypothetical protein